METCTFICRVNKDKMPILKEKGVNSNNPTLFAIHLPLEHFFEMFKDKDLSNTVFNLLDHEDYKFFIFNHLVRDDKYNEIIDLELCNLSTLLKFGSFKEFLLYYYSFIDDYFSDKEVDYEI